MEQKKEKIRRKKVRYFAGFLDCQERWLNHMAKEGWRLVRAGRLVYEFESCEPEAYEYRIEFVGHLDWNKSKDYRSFLREMGYEVFYKKINLSCSIGKVRWRPYGSGKGQITTSPGSYNKEIMIVGRQRKEGPFELHSTGEDRAAYAAVLRRVWIYMAAMCLAFGAWFGLREGFGTETIVFMAAGILSLVPLTLYHRRVRQYRREAEIEE